MKDRQQELPFVWPRPFMDNDGLLGLDHTASPLHLFQGAKKVFGVMQGPGEDGEEFLSEVAEVYPALEARFVLVLHAACATSADVLERLLALQRRSGLHWSFRLVTGANGKNLPSNVTCWDDGEAQTVAIGPTPLFKLEEQQPGHLNFVYRPEPALREEFRLWFDHTWSQAVDLDASTVRIPGLIPCTGTEEAQRMWQEYAALCSPDGKVQARVQINPETRATQIVAPNGCVTPAPSAQLGIRPLDALEERVSRLYQKGRLVSVDKYGKVPPLTVPAKASWFDVLSTRGSGTVIWEQRFRISALDDSTLKAIENRRTGISKLLPHFAYPLADGQRWMPDAAYEFFQSEVERINSEGTDFLRQAVRSNVDKFIEARTNKVRQDANEIYRELHGKGSVSEAAVREIMSELSSRLKQALGDRLLPQVNRTMIAFVPGVESGWTSGWGGPLALLHGIAAFPRESITDPYFFRGIRVPREAHIAAMNVCDDHILREGSWEQAKWELSFIGEVMKAEIDAKAKCRLLLAVIDGSSVEELQQSLGREQAAAAADSSTTVRK